MEITIHTGSMGACNKINVDWFDENGVRKANIIEINVCNMDKPRTLCIKLDGELVAVIPRQKLETECCPHVYFNAGDYWWINPHGYDVTEEMFFCPTCGKKIPETPPGSG